MAFKPWLRATGQRVHVIDLQAARAEVVVWRNYTDRPGAVDGMTVERYTKLREEIEEAGYKIWG